MILPYDPDFLETKQIMLGERPINPQFKPLAEWIDKTYAVKTINVFYDTIDDGVRPRLEICFEFPEEQQIFSNHQGFDRVKQKAIGDKFKEIVSDQGLSEFKTENIWVIYGCFKSIAQIDANDHVPEEKIDELSVKICNKDLWQIRRFFSGVTFFVYTDDQMKKYLNSEIHQTWAHMYFDILSEYDEFGYFEKEKFWVDLDSKENFDKNYNSSWFYYSR